MFSNDKWSKKLYNKTLKVIKKDTSLNWNIRIDGPYEIQSKLILETPMHISWGGVWYIATCSDFARFDVAIKLKNNPNTLALKNRLALDNRR